MRRSIQTVLSFFGLLFAVGLSAVSAAADLACTDCHNPSGIAVPHDSGCRDTSCTENCHAKDLGSLKHPTGPGTPLAAVDRTTICESCHNLPFEGVYHPYRVNVAAGTPTIPGEIDLDLSCGRCHGGGVDEVASPPAAGSPYLTKAQLGSYAAGIHDDKPYAIFGYTFDKPNTLVVNADASQTWCLDVCDEYQWDWGDGSAAGSGVTASHVYAEGNFTLTLTVRDTGIGSDSFSQPIAVRAPDYPPTASGDCAFDANTWTATLTDTSTDDRGVVRATVNWGDGGVVVTDTTSPFGPYVRTYANIAPVSPGYYTITHKAFDTAGQQGARTCTVAPAYFSISAAVRSRTGSNLPSATVTVKKGTSVVRTVYTAANGTFAVGSLKPGTYTLTVTKTSYTFANPAATITVGPSRAGTVISATAP